MIENSKVEREKSLKDERNPRNIWANINKTNTFDSFIHSADEVCSWEERLIDSSSSTLEFYNIYSIGLRFLARHDDHLSSSDLQVINEVRSWKKCSWRVSQSEWLFFSLSSYPSSSSYDHSVHSFTTHSFLERIMTMTIRRIACLLFHAFIF